LRPRFQVGVMAGRDRLHDREAQPVAARAADAFGSFGAAAVDAVAAERLEQPRHLLAGDRPSAVGHRHERLPFA
jgi:hypothetical protein